jgi:hypothetical protein
MTRHAAQNINREIGRRPMGTRHRHNRNFGFTHSSASAMRNSVAPRQHAGWKPIFLAMLAAGAIATIVGVVWLGTLVALFVRVLFDFSQVRTAAGRRVHALPPLRDPERRALADDVPAPTADNYTRGGARRGGLGRNEADGFHHAGPLLAVVAGPRRLAGAKDDTGRHRGPNALSIRADRDNAFA